MHVVRTNSLSSGTKALTLCVVSCSAPAVVLRGASAGTTADLITATAEDEEV